MNMQKYFLSIASLLVGSMIVFGLGGCSTSESSPEVVDVQFDVGRVDPGATVRIYNSFRVSANDYKSDPFFAVIVFPLGVSFQEGSSTILNGNPRAPDREGVCAGGRSYLAYDFKTADFTDPFYKDSFVGVVQIDVTVQSIADQQDVIVAASPVAIDDPCGPLSGGDATFSVSGN